MMSCSFRSRTFAAMAAAAALTVAGCSEAPEQGAFTGYIEAEMVVVSAPSGGWIELAFFDEGAQIEKGAVLFQLDADLQEAALREASERKRQADAQWRDMQTGARAEEIVALEAQLAEAEAALDLADRERSRWTQLVERKIAAVERRDQVVAEYEAAAARVRVIEANIAVARLSSREEARAAAAAARDAASAAEEQAAWTLSQRTIRSRVKGRVEEVLHRQGEFAAQGAPVVAILPDDALKVRFFVPQDQVRSIHPGDVVDVLIDGAPGPIAAKVFYVSREAEYTPPVIYSAESRDKLVFMVEARLEDPASARPGQPVDVRMRLETERVR